MFPAEHQCRGYGTQAIELIIQLARDSHKYDFLIMDCAPENTIAKHVYEKLGFRPTGERNNDEIEMRLDL